MILTSVSGILENTARKGTATMEWALPCIKCGRELRNVFPGHVENQPNDGVVFTTSGNYGSRVFDSLNGSILEITICDPCLVEAGEWGRVITARRAVPVVYEDVGLVGSSEIPEPVYVTWRKGLPEDDSQINIWEEELGDPPKGIKLNFTPEELIKMQKDLDQD